MKGGKIMKKETLLNILNCQIDNTKKCTRKDVVALVRDMVAYHIKDNADIDGISPTRDGTGVNLGEVVEVVLHAIFRNALNKSGSDKSYDLTIKGEKVEVKFSTCDAYAHPINQQQKVGYYLIVAYSKKLGGQVFKVPYANKHEINVNAQSRVTINQKPCFLDKVLTQKVFAF